MEQEPPAQDGPVELSVFWYGGTKRAELTERALRLYSDRNPLVTFRITWQGAGGYYDRLATQAGGGNVPDLFQIDDAMLDEYAQREHRPRPRRLRRGPPDQPAHPAAPAWSDYGKIDGRGSTA